MAWNRGPRSRRSTTPAPGGGQLRAVQPACALVSNAVSHEDRLTAIAVELLVSGEIQYRESVQRAHEWRIERKRQIEQQRRSAYRARDQRHSFILVTGADAEPILTPWSLLRAR